MTWFWRELERWLVGENVLAGPSGLETSFEPTWETPPPGLWMLLVTAGAILAFVYWHERPTVSRSWKMLLACLRAAVVSLLIFMLYGWMAQRHRADSSDLVIVLDDSASMGHVDQHGDITLATEIKRGLARLRLREPTRMNLARSLLLDNDAGLLKELGRRYNLRVYLAGNSARAIGGDQGHFLSALQQLAPREPASRLGDSLRDVVEIQRGRPTAAILFFTDGINTDGKSLVDTAQYARRQGIPLFFVGLGSDRPPRDLRIADLLADDAAFAGDVLNFDTKIVAEGYTGSATVRLTRSQDTNENQPASPIVVDQQEVRLDPQGTTQTIRLSDRTEQFGDFEYAVEIAPREDEVSVENNRQTRKVAVRDEAIRVLLVQAYPSYEFRFLKQMLVRELNAHDTASGKVAGVRTVLQEADPEYVETDKTAERVFPVSREALFQYDVLIVGDVNPALLSPSIMNNIYEFVTVRGGGVIFIAGPRYMPLAFGNTPLAALLPCQLNSVSVPEQSAIVTETFRPKLTPLGLSSPTLQLADTSAASERVWREDLAPIHWFASLPNLNAGVQVLAEHPTERSASGMPLPIICLQFVGAGKVIFHATDETHRWRFRVGDLYFARYWVQTIRYLCRTKLLAGSRSAELTTDRKEYRLGESIAFRLRFLDDRLAPAADNGAEVVVEQRGARRHSIRLHRHPSRHGIFEGSTGPLAEGEYRAWLASPALTGQSPSSEFTVLAPPGEFAQTQMDAAALREAADVSLGKFYTWATANRLLSDLPRGRQVRVESLQPRPIWNAPLCAALFVVLITTEWLIRKRLGLL